MPLQRSLPWLAVSAVARRPRGRAIIVALLAVPLLAAFLQVWGYGSGPSDLRPVKAAIVNDDEFVTVTGPDGEETPIGVGKLLAAHLVDDDDELNFDWTITQADEASDGLASGRYAAVLTFPENLSAATASVASQGGEDPQQGVIELTTNDLTGYLNGRIATTVAHAATAALGDEVSRMFVDNLMIGFSDMGAALDEAADGAARLADGSGELADGVLQLDDGAGQLAAGLAELHRQTSTFPRDAQRLHEGARQIDAGVRELDRGAGELHAGVGELRMGARQLAEGNGELSAGLAELAQNCPRLILFAQYCGYVREAAAGSRELAGGSSQLAQGVDELYRGTGRLTGGTGQLAEGTGQLADGTGELARSAPLLGSAIGQAHAGATQLADGTGQLAEGTGQLAEGAGELGAGLADGAEQIPRFTAGERAELSALATRPVTTAEERLHEIDSAQASRVPFAVAIAMFLGAIALGLAFAPVPKRALSSSLPAPRAALAGFAPFAVFALGQALLVPFGATLWYPVGGDRLLAFVAVTFVAGLAFCAIVQALGAWFGANGRFAAVGALLVLALASGIDRPIEGAPALMRLIDGLSPLRHAADAMGGALFGAGEVGPAIATLGLWTVAALALTVAASLRHIAPRSRALAA